MKQYPYSTPQILTDDIFISYGGQTGTTTAVQRQASYQMAEEQMTEHLSSFLVPTIITGSAAYISDRRFGLEFGNVQRLILINVKSIQDEYPLIRNTYTGTAIIRDAQYGYIDVYEPYSYYGKFDTVEVVYESGLATGTYTQPMLMTALTLAAQIHLNELDPMLSNESTADIGVQMYSNQSYSEQRVKLGTTVFGNSAMAQRIARLVKKYRSRPSARFG